MTKEKEAFYTLLTAGKESVKEALKLLKNDKALKQEIENEILPILKGSGKKTMRSLPKFLEDLSSHISRTQDLAAWVNCPPLLHTIKKTSLNVEDEAVLSNILEQLINIEDLDISSWYLTTIPKSIGKLQNLKKLSIWFDQTIALPESIGQLQNLIELDLSSNKRLVGFPTSICQLTKLKELDLRYCEQLNTIPAEIGQLQNLEVLLLGHCNLSKLPEEIGSLSKLYCLHLYENKLTVLPTSFGQLQQLKELDLEDNHFEYRPAVLQSLQLETLKLEELAEEVIKEEAPSASHEMTTNSNQDITAIYALLESRDDKKLQQALDLLRQNPNLQQKAERRYLRFIQARTNNPQATLAQLNEAAFSEENVKALITYATEEYMDTISMYGLKNEELQMIADFGGCLVANHLDVDAYLAHAKVFTTLSTLLDFIKKTEAQLLAVLEKEAMVYTEGWFGQLFKHFMELKYIRLVFDHVYDCGLNHSTLLNEFWIFLSLFLGEHQALVIHVFQATGINVTAATFLMKKMPEFRVQEGRMKFPKKYPLLVERSISCGGPDIYDTIKDPQYPLGKISLYKTYN